MELDEGLLQSAKQRKPGTWRQTSLASQRRWRRCVEHLGGGYEEFVQVKGQDLVLVSS